MIMTNTKDDKKGLGFDTEITSNCPTGTKGKDPHSEEWTYEETSVYGSDQLIEAEIPCEEREVNHNEEVKGSPGDSCW